MAADMSLDVDRLQKTLLSKGLSHLRISKRGEALIVADDDEPEARLTRLAPDMWRLDLPTHRGAWERTPFEGTLEEMVDMAMSVGRLQADLSIGQKWGATSDPSH